MKLSVILKSGIGLLYTTFLLAAIYFGAVWPTQFIIKLTWVGAIIFWLIGIPIIMGLFHFLATITAIPVAYLMKGSKWLSWILLAPALYFMFRFGYSLWVIASNIGEVLIWLLMIGWFFETLWLFAAYLHVAIGSAYETDELS